jgi:tripartite-type tricarboxylate transporter receptor subunit TctC
VKAKPIFGRIAQGTKARKYLHETYVGIFGRAEPRLVSGLAALSAPTAKSRISLRPIGTTTAAILQVDCHVANVENSKTKPKFTGENAMQSLFGRVVAAFVVMLALVAPVAADDYPNRPVHLIIPFPPGGSNDVVGRLVAKQLGEHLGQQIVVDNRGGAGGVIGTEVAAGAAPDGYTLLVISIAHAVNPALHTLAYDPIKSFTPVSILASGPNVLVVNPELKVNSVKELVALAKAKPGELNYASAGIGSFQHLGGELFKLTAGVNIVHVPYKGGGPAMQDVIGGNVKIMFSSLIQTTPFIKSGQLRPLGIGGTRRSPILPDVPTIAEAGVPGYVAENWWGIVAPAGLPAPIVDKLYKATQAALKAPELQEEFAREGASSVEMSSAEFGDYIKSEITKWTRVVHEGGITGQ